MTYYRKTPGKLSGGERQPMFKKLSKVITFLPVLFSLSGNAQLPDFGSLKSFVLFTSGGAVGNTGVSNITGNIGANVGAISGFGAPTTVNGTIYNADGVTAQCVTDLQAAYDQLSLIPATNTTHAPAFGSGETLFAGVYSIAGAGSLAGTIILDGQGDGNAVFIFKMAGAFTTGASATVVLANGASSCNIFWVAEGAISMAALTTMKGTLIAHPGAVSMGANCNLEGRMFSTAGAVSVYSVQVINGCSGITSWTGAMGTTDWFMAGNWDNGVPYTNREALIPSSLISGRFYPVVDTGFASVDSITIQNGATLAITSTLQVNGAIINYGTTDADSGTIEMTGSSAQTIAANTFLNNALNNLLISNTSAGGVSLSGPLDLYGSLNYSATGMILNTHDALTLKSTAFNTAWVGNMTNHTITGKVTVERYIPRRKAWQFLSIPTNTTQTIQQAWQEGASNIDSDLVKGYGTQITGPGGVPAGFDIYTATPSMKKYNSVNNSWIGIPNTNMTLINATDGYMTFIRGDRSATRFTSPVTSTVLRTKGNLYTGDQTPIIVAVNKFASIGNPYASAVDMRNIVKTGIKDFFYVWDPKLSGIYGLGAYQTFSYNGGNYVVTPGSGSYGIAGSMNNYLESGKAFFVQADSTGGSLSFNEGAKSGGAVLASRPASFPGPQLRASLYELNAGGSSYIIDGFLVDYDAAYSNLVDNMDAVKATNTAENLATKNANNLLVIERRHSIIEKDTIFLNLTNTTARQYRFKFSADQLNTEALSAFLEDSYLGSRTPLNLNGSTTTDFNIVNIPGSYAADRFRIVFTAAAVLPLHITSIKAYKKNAGIVVDWQVENEGNTNYYDLEKSTNGRQFTSLFITPAIGNNGHAQSYLQTDMHPINGYNYYRIKSVGLNDQPVHTSIVKVLITKGKQDINIYPNTISNGVINMAFNDMPDGKYAARLLNKQGQKLIEEVIQHAKGSGTEQISINKRIPHGIYCLEISTPSGNIINKNVAY